MKHLVPTGFLALSLLLAACGGEPAEQASNKPKYDYERADSLDKDFLRGLATIRVNIEETAKMNEAMAQGGFSFNGSACNSASRASSYSGSKAQALALGVFAADMNYATAYQSSNEVRGYMDATMTLAEKLGVKAAFDADIIGQLVEADSTTNRSLLLTKAYLNAENQLYSEDRSELATLMIIGGWTEGMWLVADAMKNKGLGNNQFQQGLFSHAYTYNKVMEMVKIFADRGNQDFIELQTELKKAGPAVNKVISSNGAPNDKARVELHSSMSALRKAVAG